jgi:hypothetical protein
LSILAGKSARELSELARTFLRRAGDQLYVGIYYSRWLIGFAKFGSRSINFPINCSISMTTCGRRLVCERDAL